MVVTTYLSQSPLSCLRPDIHSMNTQLKHNCSIMNAAHQHKVAAQSMWDVSSAMNIPFLCIHPQSSLWPSHFEQQ